MREIGEKLKQTRQAKGLSLEDVQKKTKIHLNILKAIEGDGLTDLSPVYLRAFIKIYAKFLGLKPEEMMPEHKEEAVKQQAADLKPPEVKLKAVKTDRKFFKKLFLLFIAVIVIFALFKLVKLVASRFHKSSGAAVEKVIPVKTARAQAKQGRKEISDGVRLVVIAKQNCVVTLKVDGKVFFQGVMKKGRSESWKAKERMDLSLSNAGAVELIVNSQHFSNIGKPKQKLNNIVIDREGLHIGR